VLLTVDDCVGYFQECRTSYFWQRCATENGRQLSTAYNWSDCHFCNYVV